MRALVLAGLLVLSLSAPALAHTTSDGAQGLHLTDLVLTFDPLSQSQVYSFELENEDDGPAGGLFATVTLVDGQLPITNVRVGGGLASGETASFEVKVPLRVSLSGCIHVFTTVVGQNKHSNKECGTTSGLTQAPVSVPGVPEAPEDIPPTLP